MWHFSKSNVDIYHQINPDTVVGDGTFNVTVINMDDIEWTMKDVQEVNSTSGSNFSISKKDRRMMVDQYETPEISKRVEETFNPNRDKDKSISTGKYGFWTKLRVVGACILTAAITIPIIIALI